MNRFNIFFNKVHCYALATARQFYECVFKNSKNKTILIIMPAASGSLGDQAMLESVVDNLNLLGMTSFRQILLPNASSFPVKGRQLPWIRINPDDISMNNKVVTQLVSRADAIVAIGADVIDGRYGMRSVNFQLKLLTLASTLNRPAALLGFSVSNDYHPDAIQMLAGLPSSVGVFVRDPISLARFEKLTSRPAILSADLAFLVNPDYKSASYKKWAKTCAALKKNNYKILCLNINGLNKSVDNVAGVDLDYWKNFILKLVYLNPNLTILLLSHDYREGSSDSSVHKALYESLKHYNIKLFLVEDVETAAIAKSITSLVDLVLAGRMHLGIGSISLGIPTFFLAYAGKFEGLVQMVDEVESIAPVDVLVNPVELAIWLSSKLPECLQMRQRLINKLPAIKNLSNKNFLFVRSEH